MRLAELSTSNFNINLKILINTFHAIFRNNPSHRCHNVAVVVHCLGWEALDKFILKSNCGRFPARDLQFDS